MAKIKIDFNKLGPLPEDISPKDKVTLISYIVHQSRVQKSNFTANPEPFSRELESNEYQAITHHFIVLNDDWMELPCAFLPRDKVRFICVENRTGRSRQLMPSVEEAALERQTVLMLRCKGAQSSLLIPPGSHMILEMENFADWEWKSAGSDDSPPLRTKLSLIPK